MVNFSKVEDVVQHHDKQRALFQSNNRFSSLCRWLGGREGSRTASAPYLSPDAKFENVLVCVDVDEKRIGKAQDGNGRELLLEEVNSVNERDQEVMNGITDVQSTPEDKMNFVLDNDDADRLLGEMLSMDRREFYWCYEHGLMTGVPSSHKVFAYCRRQ